MVEINRFTAAWCGPCRTYKPIFEEVAERLSDKAQFNTVDLDKDDTNKAGEFGIRSIPATVIVKDGVPVKTEIGLLTTTQLEEIVNKYA